MEATTLPRERRFVVSSPRLLATMGDDRLVAQVRRGNQAAFEALYDRHHRGILSFTRHMLGSREEAEDAVQQTFLSAYNDMVGTDKPLQVKAWLYAIARNRSLSMLRARRETPSEVPEISTAGLADEVQERDDLRQLVADMGDLPEQQRAALVLAEIGDLSHTEVANVVGCEVTKVKSLVFQARSSLLESRKARDSSCEEIREQISTLTGGALRRGTIRRHVDNCEGCREFREDVRRQRAMMAIVLPVIPTLGLKETALAAVGIGGGVGGGGAVAVGGGGVLAGVVGKVGIAKLATIAAVVGGSAIGGGVAVMQSDSPSSAGGAANAAPDISGRPGYGGAGAGGGSPSGGTNAALADDDAERKAERKAEKRAGKGRSKAERRVARARRKRAQARRKADRRSSRQTAQERAEKRDDSRSGSGDQGGSGDGNRGRERRSPPEQRNRGNGNKYGHDRQEARSPDPGGRDRPSSTQPPAPAPSPTPAPTTGDDDDDDPGGRDRVKKDLEPADG